MILIEWVVQPPGDHFSTNAPVRGVINPHILAASNCGASAKNIGPAKRGRHFLDHFLKATLN